MPDPVFQLLYVSAAAVPFSTEDLRWLLVSARLHNARLGVTGLLVHSAGSFLQVLEGTELAVTDLFEKKIALDPRHNNIFKVFASRMPARGFEDWTMGFVEPNQELSGLPGFSDFLKSGFAARKDTPALAARVRDLALQFRMGRWRQHVDFR